MTENERYIGIDPGTSLLGYAAIEVVNKKIRVLEVDVLDLHEVADHAEKLQHIYQKINQLVGSYRPQSLAIESPFYGKNIQVMLKLGRAQGVAMAAAMAHGVPIFEYSPRDIKQAITGKGNATKDQVAAMLNYMLGYEVNATYRDATDALAVAIAHYHRNGSSRTLGGKKSHADWGSFLKSNPDKVKK